MLKILSQWLRASNRFCAVLCLALVALASLSAAPSAAAERAQVLVTNEAGFGRLVIGFKDRLDLPPFKLRVDNGVMSLTFETAVQISLPDVAQALPDYVSVARLDPDGKGIRFGLKGAKTFNSIEAGERLFIDLLPSTWQGLPPALPPEVLAELTERTRNATQQAEQRRKAEQAKLLQPVAKVRIGRAPTFMRIQFTWNVDTDGTWTVQGEDGSIDFGWPVPVDVSTLLNRLPPEFKGVSNAVSPDGSRVLFRLAEGVAPRFYKTDKRTYFLDFDLKEEAAEAKPAIDLNEHATELAVADHEAVERAEAALEHEEHPATANNGTKGYEDAPESAGAHKAPLGPLKPYLSTIGSTIRVVFPFDQDTAAAAFRRGNILWMLFDTTDAIEPLPESTELAAIATEFSVLPVGDAQIVRIDLSSDRLPTLGSEGRAWVLSLGDVLLNSTEPVDLARRKDARGLFEMTADLQRPARVHQMRDPVVGDMLSVVTIYPPARGLIRTQEFVDFTALPSVHGLVLKSGVEDLDVGIQSKLAIIRSKGGLQLSAPDAVPAFDIGQVQSRRSAYTDFNGLYEPDPAVVYTQSTQRLAEASGLDGDRRNEARLNLARFYLANGLGMEAVGVLRVMQDELKGQDSLRQVDMARAIADTVAGRPQDAMATLGLEAGAGEVDALFWRAIARSDLTEFPGARADAASAEPVASGYPLWMRNLFFMAAARAAVETSDPKLAKRYLGLIEVPGLSKDQASSYRLLSGRADEGEGKTQDALDAYGKVIAEDIRPTRAEAVYRTLALLNGSDTLDVPQATKTLAAEAMLWRGAPIEADMSKLLAELYFRQGEYRLGFEVAKQAAQFNPSSVPINALIETAQSEFAQLYLDGKADALDPVQALAIYYDYRDLTPPGSGGDAMVRNLAARLVKLDLLPQATELLAYQVENRLKGATQAQAAADLAVVYIADRKPELALKLLNRTRLADLAPSIERQRRILEVRSLIDVGREDLAIDLLANLSGRDADLLRVDAQWRAKRYNTAAEQLELMYEPDVRVGPLSKSARLNIVKAAVGFVLANDRIGLSRLRSRFADSMSNSAEWGMFNYVTVDAAPDGKEIVQIARQIAGLESLNGFLASYKAEYGATGALAPDAATGTAPPQA